MVSVDASLICHPTSEDIKNQRTWTLSTMFTLEKEKPGKKEGGVGRGEEEEEEEEEVEEEEEEEEEEEGPLSDMFSQ